VLHRSPAVVLGLGCTRPVRAGGRSWLRGLAPVYSVA
jgi:hypothetical protein